MTTLEDLKKRATASEAVLIERVEALVAEQAKTDAKERLRKAIEAVGVPRLDSMEMHTSGDHPIRTWLTRIYAKFDESQP